LALVGTTNAYDPQRPALVVFAFEGLDSDLDPRSTKDDVEERLLQRFGQPNRVQAATGGDRFGPIQTKFWHYEGLQIQTGQYVGESRTWIRKITLTGAAYKLKFGLSIGAKKDQFLEKLGPPDPSVKPTSHSLTYFSDYYWSEGGVAFASHAEVQIFFDQQGRGEKITWRYFAD
jgi:hypothetical protein